MNSFRTGSRWRASSNQLRRHIESRSRSNSCRKAKRLGTMDRPPWSSGHPSCLAQSARGLIGWRRRGMSLAPRCPGLALLLPLDHLLSVIGRSPFLLDSNPNEFAVSHDAPERALPKGIQGLLVRCHSTQDGLALEVAVAVAVHRLFPSSATVR